MRVVLKSMVDFWLISGGVLYNLAENGKSRALSLNIVRVQPLAIAFNLNFLRSEIADSSDSCKSTPGGLPP